MVIEPLFHSPTYAGGRDVDKEGQGGNYESGNQSREIRD